MPALFGPAQADCSTSIINENGITREPRTRTKYYYDATGRRVHRTGYTNDTCDNTGKRDYVFDLEGRVIVENNSAGTACDIQVYAGERHFGRQGGGSFFYHSDWLGTVRLINSDADPTYGAEVCTSLPFGDGLTCNSNYSNVWHFTGKERDYESGLDNFGARYDASSMGRFMSPDPDGAGAATRAPQSWNAYTYVLNNPISAVDPTGLWCVWEDKTHDDDPENGGIDNNPDTGCEAMGGHWDPTDTITGMDGPLGTVTQEIPVDGMITDDDRIKMIAAGVSSATSPSSLSEVGVNGMTWAAAAEGLWELPGIIRGGWRAIASWRMASKMAGVRAAGEAGEALAGIVKNTKRIPSVTGAAYRVPDILDSANKVIGEVKNYNGTLSLTEQIKDDVAFAKANGYTMILKVSQSTELTQPLRLLVNDGTIKLVRFP